LGFRTVYRGLAPYEAKDAAVFFGRNAEIVRSLARLRSIRSTNKGAIFSILGASGAGKSSFLRAGLFPRLVRDDGAWLPLVPIRAAGGSIAGPNGLLFALEEAHLRLGIPMSISDLRGKVRHSPSFLTHLEKMRVAAAERALSDKAPTIVVCLD